LTENDALARRWRMTHRALPLGWLALVALGVGVGFGAAHRSADVRVAERFARAWDRGDYVAMHRLLGPDERARFPLATFRATHEDAAAIATSADLTVRDPDGERDGEPLVRVSARTRVFGTVRGVVAVPVAEDATVAWAPHLAFPGVRPGEKLTRRTEVPRRGDILSRDGEVLASGPAEARKLDDGAAAIAGTVAAADDRRERERTFARGFPKDMPVGTNGLEKALQNEVEGTAGGTLLAGGREIARARAKVAPPARSTIDLDLQLASDAALAGRFGGIAVLDPLTAEVLALSGVAFSAPQPPGSTFKIVTTTAALDDAKVKLTDEFPVESLATIDGVPLSNANGELCGGSFVSSFAHSCNSVFAPLGVKVGAKSLVAVAEKFGWNATPEIDGAEPSTLPEAEDITSPLDLGSSAIGQGRVLATPLQMASVAQTIANDGVRVAPTLVAGERGRRTKVTSAKTANAIERMMIDVVGYGTGTAAAVPGVKVAGKTGTAELGDTRGENAVGSDPSNTDAWFTSYAPAGKPEVVVAALFVRNGSGGAVAAPAVQTVLVKALGR